jgi:hypothetical protein
MTKVPFLRKHLSPDALYWRMHRLFQDVPDQRGERTTALADALMSGFALFALKDPSLLAFDQRRKQDDHNLQFVFHIGGVPCDTQMREVLDPLDPEQLRPVFRDIFAQLAQGKVLEEMLFLDDFYLLALDGTEYFSSSEVHCQQCLCKKRHTGEIVYHHSLLGAVLVCPQRREVIPLMPEPILRQDGQTKNDCERNALARWLTKFRQDHPHLRVIATLDALYANAPVIGDLSKALVPWIIRVKEDDHAFLFAQVRQRAQAGQVEDFSLVGSDGVHRHFRLARDLPLNESHPEVRVDFLAEDEMQGDGKYRTALIVDPVLRLCRERAETVMWGGRSRWKVENETFNTLKNQGYHLEHNYGHGHQNLSVVLAMLMMLAFLVDQTSQLCCALFTAAWEKCGSKRALWEGVREIFHRFSVESMAEIYAALLYGHEKPAIQLLGNTS